MSTKIVINGALGRMGIEIAKAVISDKQAELSDCLEVSGHPKSGTDIGVVVGSGELGVKVKTAKDDVSFDNKVVIDFASPQGISDLLNSLKDTTAGLVIGTTGHSDEQLKEISEFSKTHPVILSPNMSLGVNLLFHITEIVAKKIGDSFDIEIIEAHHRFKKDSPSGTAKRLGEIVVDAIDTTWADSVIHGREGIGPERPAKEVGMHAVRGGDIVGDHTVLFAGMGERLELSHRAQSRSTFAHGAVTAAKWLNGKDTGLYSMKDVLGL